MTNVLCPGFASSARAAATISAPALECRLKLIDSCTVRAQGSACSVFLKHSRMAAEWNLLVELRRPTFGLLHLLRCRIVADRLPGFWEQPQRTFT
jgi:hypothetical protein